MVAYRARAPQFSAKIHDEETALFDVHTLDSDGINIVKTRQPGNSRSQIPQSRFEQRRYRQILERTAGVRKRTDGIITSVAFVLHKMPKYTRTVCMEFSVRSPLPRRPSSKSATSCLPMKAYDWPVWSIWTGVTSVPSVMPPKQQAKGRPKMVLLADVVSDDEAAVQAAAEHICRTRPRSRRRRLYRRVARSTQNLLARPQPRNTLSPNTPTTTKSQRRNVVIPLRKARRVFRWHRTHQH